MATTTTERVLAAVRKAGVLRSRDLEAHGIPRQYLRVLCDRGLIRRVGRGLYALEGGATENRSLAEACKRVPKGVICLLSALRFHGLTTQAPFVVWMAIDPKAWKPSVDQPPLRIVRFSGKALTEGVEKKLIEGVPIHVFDPAKTVADCFKYRNKIGLDVALEALRDCWRKRKATMDELWVAAKICRMTSVMRPYLEMLAAA